MTRQIEQLKEEIGQKDTDLKNGKRLLYPVSERYTVILA